jgi:anti-anti-sigma factor
MPKFDVQIEESGDITILTISGPIDSATIEEFREKANPAFSKKGVKLLLDCKDLTYMNSRALGYLTTCRRQCYAQGGRIVMASLNKKIVRTMDLLGLGKLLKSYDSREEALQALQ